mmetsp:Transcript_11404/g.26868  ORF Transcript_11404/g.26868 Transcript_11404/m.26868 type:complete len:448 (-) Transcript_11404:125-1468(-)
MIGPKFAFHFLSKLPTTNILQLQVVVEEKDETGAVSDVGRNAVNHVVGMHERLALETWGQGGAILAEVVQLATLLDGRVVVEGNKHGGILHAATLRLVGVVLEESVAVGGSAHVADLDSFERNGSPDNFFVKIKQGVEFDLSDDRHEVRLVNVLLVVLIENLVFRAKDNQRHKAVAIFLRQDVLLLSRAGVQINLVSERVDKGSNGSFLLESIRHVLEGKSTIAHVDHAIGSINAWIDATTALAALPALGGLWGLWGLCALAARAAAHRGKAPQIDRTNKRKGAPSDLRVVGNVGIKHNQIPGLGVDVGGAVDEHGMGIVVQDNEGGLALDGLARVVVAVDVHIGGAGYLGDGDGAKILHHALLLGRQLRAGHIKKALEDGGMEARGTERATTFSSFLVKVDGSELLDFVQGQEFGIRINGGGESGGRQEGRTAEQAEGNGGGTAVG